MTTMMIQKWKGNTKKQGKSQKKEEDNDDDKSSPNITDWRRSHLLNGISNIGGK